MGAQNISDAAKASTMAKAYEKCVAEALHESGINAYNGTISTTNGFIEKTALYESLVKEHGKEKGLSKWYEEGWEHTEKWEEVWGALIETHGDSNEGTYVFVGWASV